MAKAKVKVEKKVARELSVEQTMASAWQAYGEARYSEAEKLCERLLKAIPDHAHAWYLRGLAAAAQGRGELAFSYWEQVKNAPDLIPALAQGRGRALLSLGRVEEALAQFQDAMTYQPDEATNYYFIGLASAQLGALEDARRYFRQASVLDAEFGFAHYELGVVNMQMGHYPQALTAFKAAAALMPRSPEAANNLALAHQALGEAEPAEAALRQALALRDDYAEAWLNLGLLLRAQGREEAETCIARALALNPALQTLLSAHE